MLNQSGLRERICQGTVINPISSFHLSKCAHIAFILCRATAKRAHPDLNQGPADLQSAALTTELCTHLTAAHNLCIKAKLQLPLFCSAEKIHLLLPQAAFVSLRIFLMFGHGGHSAQNFLVAGMFLAHSYRRKTQLLAPVRGP